MSPANRAIVERTWGLHEVQVHQTQPTPEHIKRLAYGPNFVYDEFLVTNNTLLSMLVNLGSAFLAFCLITPPVSSFISSSDTPAQGSLMMISRQDSRPYQAFQHEIWRGTIRGVCLSCKVISTENLTSLRRTMRRGYLETTNITETSATADVPKIHVQSVIRGKGDPGYSLSAGTLSSVPPSGSS